MTGPDVWHRFFQGMCETHTVHLSPCSLYFKRLFPFQANAHNANITHVPFAAVTGKRRRERGVEMKWEKEESKR